MKSNLARLRSLQTLRKFAPDIMLVMMQEFAVLPTVLFAGISLAETVWSAVHTTEGKWVYALPSVAFEISIIAGVISLSRFCGHLWRKAGWRPVAIAILLVTDIPVVVLFARAL